jgi:hypothetical protein
VVLSVVVQNILWLLFVQTSLPKYSSGRKLFMSVYSLVVQLLQHLHHEAVYKSESFSLPWQRATAITVGRFESRTYNNCCMLYTVCGMLYTVCCIRNRVSCGVIIVLLYTYLQMRPRFGHPCIDGLPLTCVLKLGFLIF